MTAERHESTRNETFHAGEITLQREAGVSERMARIGPQMIRDRLPEQHRAFFPLLPFLVVGSLGEGGQPAASLLGGPPGFATSPDPSTLRVAALPFTGDPLDSNLRAGAPLGVLGLQPHTRRRNRVNGDVIERDAHGFSLGVRQSFGNRPKYITRREPFFSARAALAAGTVTKTLTARHRSLIEGADTFFIATAHPSAGRAQTAAEGVDVSHRGGPPGFAHFVDDATFVIPDYPGNNVFMTLGNLRLHGAAGLCFSDAENGDMLQLGVTADVIAAAHPFAKETGRVLRFRVHEVRFSPEASPVRYFPAEASAFAVSAPQR